MSTTVLQPKLTEAKSYRSVSPSRVSTRVVTSEDQRDSMRQQSMPQAHLHTCDPIIAPTKYMAQQDPQHGACVARKYGIRIDPPTLSLEYQDVDGKRRVRAVKLVKLSLDTDVDRLTRKVIRSFPRRLDATTVKYEQVRKLVFKLLEAVRQSASSPAAATASHTGRHSELPPPHPSISPKGDHPQVSRILGDSCSLRHSSESRFSTSTVSIPDDSPAQHSQGLEELDHVLGELDRELDMPPSSAHTQHSSHRAPVVAQPHTQPATVWDHSVSAHGHMPASAHRESVSGRSRFAQEAEEQLVLEPDLPEDLNKVTETELMMAKAKMDQHFHMNRLRPGDPGYEYDKQVEFAPPTESNDWDEDSDEAG